MNQKEEKREIPQEHEIGILYERVPHAGVVVQGFDVDELLAHPNVQESEVDDTQRELGANRAISFKPGVKDQFGLEYSEYMVFDSKNRPLAANKRKGGIFSYRFFEYDQLGRLIKIMDNLAYKSANTQEFTYSAETPDGNGQFPFTLT